MVSAKESTVLTLLLLLRVQVASEVVSLGVSLAIAIITTIYIV